MRTSTLAFVLLTAAGVAQAAAPPPGIEVADTRRLSPGELPAILATLADGWVAWSVPALPGRRVCCRPAPPSTSACCADVGARSLEVGAAGNDDENWRLVVLVRLVDGQLDQVRIASESCRPTADVTRLLWLDGVTEQDSLAALEPRARSPRSREHHAESLLAIALHHSSAADPILERLASDAGSPEARREALLWLAEERGKAGLAAIERVLAAGPGRELERHIAFVLTLSPVPEAAERLASMARHADDPEVRSQALFWLAHSGSTEAEALLLQTIESDPSEAARAQAVFALSQLPDRRAVDALLDLLRATPRDDVRRQVLFWLAQSDDPRALDSVVALLDD